MKPYYLLLLILTGFQAMAQPPAGVTVMDFVKIKNNHYKEALYYYENNWKAYREEALKRGIIQSYQLLSVAADSAADFHLVLLTVYKDSVQYGQSEAAFAPILKALRPAGPLLLNGVQPGDFRQNLYYKVGSALFTGVAEEIEMENSEGTEATIVSDSLGIVITQNSTYLMPGQELEISVLPSCNLRNQIQSISIGGSTLRLSDKGTAVYKTPAGYLGVHTIPISITFLNDKGVLQQKLHNINYTVGQASFCVALDRMNVLYVGVDNPVTIAAAGAGDDKIAVSVSQGAISKVGPGRYLVRVNTVSDECIITVMVDGKMAGASLFRTRYLPLPTATVGGFKSGDTIAAAAFRAQAGVSGNLRDFVFDVRYEVVSYRIKIPNEKGEIVTIKCQGPAFSSEAKAAINKYVKPGAIVTIDELKVKDATGREMRLPSLLYYIK